MKLFDLYTRVTCTKLKILTCFLFLFLFCSFLPFGRALALAHRRHHNTIYRISFFGAHSLFIFCMSMSCGHFVCVISIPSSSHSVVHLSVQWRYGCSWWCPSHSEHAKHRRIAASHQTHTHFNSIFLLSFTLRFENCRYECAVAVSRVMHVAASVTVIERAHASNRWDSSESEWTKHET